jgi:hypothetical protein
MFNSFLATDKNTGAIVDLLPSFNKSNKTLKEFMAVLRLRFNRVDIQIIPLCLACPFDAISITYTV